MQIYLTFCRSSINNLNLTPTSNCSPWQKLLLFIDTIPRSENIQYSQLKRIRKVYGKPIKIGGLGNEEGELILASKKDRIERVELLDKSCIVIRVALQVKVMATQLVAV